MGSSWRDTTSLYGPLFTIGSELHARVAGEDPADAAWLFRLVAALAVPQALGYAAIAGVPVQLGLYAVPIALLVYAALGSSPQLVVGPVSTVSVLSATLVASMHPTDVAQAVTYTSAIALAAALERIVG